MLFLPFEKLEWELRGCRCASSKKDDEILEKIFSLANQNCSNARVFGDPPKINQSEDSSSRQVQT